MTQFSYHNYTLTPKEESRLAAFNPNKTILSRVKVFKRVIMEIGIFLTTRYWIAMSSREASKKSDKFVNDYDKL
jgi:hypothetical protein